MLKIYTIPSRTSCRRAIEWFEKQNIFYEEINISTDSMTKKELLLLLSLTEKGVEEIISKKSISYNALNIDFDTMHLEEFLNIVIQNPTLLRSPLITDGKKLQVGYNVDDIRKFLSQKTRKISLEILTQNLKEEYLGIK